MSLFSRPAMSEALRLTRAGDLTAATRQILATLGGQAHRTAPMRNGGELVPNQLRIGTDGSGRATPSARGTSRFEPRRCLSEAGDLDYWLYVPAGAGTGCPLIVMLHGCTQSPEDFARGTRMNSLADELGYLVAYPKQTQTANAQECWNWFRAGDQGRDRGEPAMLAAMVRQIIVDEDVDPARVYAAGLSAGGAMAAILADAYPDIFAAIGIHSGLPAGCARNLPGALSAMRTGGRGKPVARSLVPTICFQGDRDQTVHAANSDAIVAAALPLADSPLLLSQETAQKAGRRRSTRELHRNDRGEILIERWTIHGASHAWAGGDAAGTYTDPTGPDASREMARFFLSHRKGS